MSDAFDQPVSELPGVGPERRAHLARLGLGTIRDLLLHRPRRYEDRRKMAVIRDITPGQVVTVRARVLASGVKHGQQRGKSRCEVIIEDDSGRLTCRWWNLPYMRNHFQVGEEIFAHGMVAPGEERRMDHPETETVVAGEESGIHLNRIVPVYPLTDGLSQRWLRSLLWRLAGEWRERIPDASPGLRELAFLSEAEAVYRLHVPESLDQAEQARRRLAMDEFVALQSEILARRRRMEQNARAQACRGTNQLIRPFLKQLGFELTPAQTKVLREIRSDMGGRFPMRRLLQGDVGSGKTVVAACAIMMTMESGRNALLMAPTEILAEQHYLKFSDWFGGLGLGVRVLTGSRKSELPDELKGAPHLIIGTHALLEDSFTVENLGLAVIDEQHKFGVVQRQELVRKGDYPHLLVMTATPIPRSLGLTLYGDLDLSVLDELPRGRGTIQTYVRGEDKMPKILEFVRDQLRSGRQAYFVYPRIDESEREGTRALAAEKAAMQAALAPWAVGLLHGRLPSVEKESAMREFREKRIHVLLATAVIEVGLDVPNASVMLVMDAGQFGLAQLHQLRGRIGRGPHPSFCILVARKKTAEAFERLRIMERTLDGFVIAEEDFRLRGAGDLTGLSQSGLPDFRFGDLRGDRALVEQAREWVRRQPAKTGEVEKGEAIRNLGGSSSK